MYILKNIRGTLARTVEIEPKAAEKDDSKTIRTNTATKE